MKYEIDIEGLPEGWKAVAYRVPKGNIEFVLIGNVVREAKPQDKKCLIVEKIQPRRIVLEETTELNHVEYSTQNIILSNEMDGVACVGIRAKYVWREVKGNS